MRGDIDTEKMSQVEAKLVSALVNTYYLQDEKYLWVNTFNHRPNDFSFDGLVKDLQTFKAKRDGDDEKAVNRTQSIMNTCACCAFDLHVCWKAEYSEWREDELDRREQYDREVEMGNRPQHGGATPWNPPLNEGDHFEPFSNVCLY